MRRAVRRLGAVVTVLTAVGVAGCGASEEHPSVAPLAQIAVSQPTAAANGIDTMPAPEALERSLDAMRATGTYRVSGTTGAGEAIDISFDAGVGAVGTVTSDQPVRLIATDGAVYVSGDPEYLAEKLGADVDKTIAGKWLLLGQGDAPTAFTIFADGARFASAVLRSVAPTEVTKVTEVAGQPAVGLVFPDTGATLWVAAAGQPLPIRFEEQGASAGTGVLTFSDFGAQVSVAPPSADAIVDLGKLPDPAAE